MGVKAHYSIGELAKMFGVSAESLRNWEKNGKLPQPVRTPGGHRRYNESHAEALRKLFTPWMPDEVVTTNGQ